MISSSFKMVFLIILLVLQIYGLQACGGGSDSPSPLLSLSGTIPTQFTDRLLEENQLTAEISIDGNTPAHLQVDSENRRIHTVLSALSPGSHDFSIQLFLNNILIAQVEATADFTADNTVILAYSDIRYLDSDADGFSNLAELLIFGMNSRAWNDPATHPSSEFSRHSAHYVMVDSFGAAFLSGYSQSHRYNLTTGFIPKGSL